MDYDDIDSIVINTADDKVEFDRKKEMQRLKKLLTKRHRCSAKSIAACDQMLFDSYFRALTWLNMQMLSGATKGTLAYASVVDKTYWIVKDMLERKSMRNTEGDQRIEIGCELEAPTFGPNGVTLEELQA